MMKRLMAVAGLAALLLVGGVRSADAHVGVSIGIGVPGIVFGAPVYAPAYYPPPPPYYYGYGYGPPYYYGGSVYGPPVVGGVFFGGRFGHHRHWGGGGRHWAGHRGWR